MQQINAYLPLRPNHPGVQAKRIGPGDSALVWKMVCGHIASNEPRPVPQSVARAAMTTAHDGPTTTCRRGPTRRWGWRRGQAAQHDSRDTSRLNAWAASRRLSDMVR